MQDFLENAFNHNYSYVDAEQDTYTFYQAEIGKLHVVSGKIIACDPFLFDGNEPIEFLFPIGQFPVELAIARFNDDERIGFARIKFSNKLSLRWEIAVTVNEDANTLSEDEIFGYAVDSGTGCFMDIYSAEIYSNFLNQKKDNYKIIGAEMEATYKHTRSWLMWEKGNDNVAMFSSGWGDGVYATYIGYDSENKISRLVTDFGAIE